MTMLSLIRGAGQLSHSEIVQSSLLQNIRCLVRLFEIGSSNSFSTTGCCDAKALKRYHHVSKRTHKWEPQKSMKEIYGYTADPVPVPKHGGRGPNGRVWDWRIGGGFQKHVYMVDWVRGGPSSGEPVIERVLDIKTDDCKSAKLALVGRGEKKRWIIATTNMQIGDLIKSSTDTTISDLKGWNEGDSLPLVCMPQGQLVHCVQNYPGSDGRITCAAGSVAQVIRHIEDKVVLRLPSKQEIMINNKCTATLGKAAAKFETRQKMYKAGQKRWLGIRPKSGLFKKKTGYMGRKDRSGKKLKEYSASPGSKPDRPIRLFNDVPFT